MTEHKYGRLRVKSCKVYYGAKSKALDKKRVCDECSNYVSLREMYYDRSGDTVCSQCSRAEMTVSDMLEILQDQPPETLIRFFGPKDRNNEFKYELAFFGTADDTKKTFSAISILFHDRDKDDVGRVGFFDPLTTSYELDALADSIGKPLDGDDAP